MREAQGLLGVEARPDRDPQAGGQRRSEAHLPGESLRGILQDLEARAAGGDGGPPTAEDLADALHVAGAVELLRESEACQVGALRAYVESSGRYLAQARPGAQGGEADGLHGIRHHLMGLVADLQATFADHDLAQAGLIVAALERGRAYWARRRLAQAGPEEEQGGEGGTGAN